MNFDYPQGATPLDPDEIEGLLPSHITNRSELDRWEQDNIMEAEVWAFRRKPDEIAARFHHRLVSTHLFANGNGRHALLIADLFLIHTLGHSRFTWGSESLVQAGECRQKYIYALQNADRRDYEKLLRFVRS